jgi:hypothetical protein
MATLPRRQAVRFVLPLREGGSMPALVDADDGEGWVVKLRGAAQGPRALIAEVICGELALGRTEGDPEVRDLLLASAGDNLGMAFLPGAIAFDAAADGALPPGFAGRLVAFDVLVSNVDRTARNPNLLWSGGTLWMIDHGAALYWHHAASWPPPVADAGPPLPRLVDHVLLPRAGRIDEAAAELAEAIGDDAITDAVAAVPDDWLLASWPGREPAALRAAYRQRLAARRDALVGWCREAA